MTAHDEALHPRDTASGEFTTKTQSAPEEWIEVPNPSSAQVEEERLEGEYAQLPDNDEPETLRRRFSLASQILAVRTNLMDLETAPHRLILSDEGDGEGFPYWMPSKILDVDGVEIWVSPRIDDDDYDTAEWLGQYTPSLDRLGRDAVTLPDGQTGIVL